MSDDGVRVLDCDGSGSFIDSTRTGNLKWGYALAPDDKRKLTIQSFDQWQVAQADGDAPAGQMAIFVDAMWRAAAGVGQYLAPIICLLDAAISACRRRRDQPARGSAPAGGEWVTACCRGRVWCCWRAPARRVPRRA